jgi:23S rRNA pseudouridine2604 synthase
MTEPSSSPHGPVRLNKRMAELGMCSRREADEWIANGWVKVNGKPAEMGVKVTPSDRIEIDKGPRASRPTRSPSSSTSPSAT